MDCSEAVLDSDRHYSELFSLFENAQDYFNNAHQVVFHDLFTNIHQLPSKIERAKTSNVQAARRFQNELGSVEERLNEVKMHNELCKAHCENQRTALIDLEIRVCNEKNAHRELEKAYVRESLKHAILELEWSQSLRNVADKISKRLTSRISAEMNDTIASPEQFSDPSLNAKEDINMQ